MFHAVAVLPVPILLLFFQTSGVHVIQVDGANDSDSEDDEDEDDDDDDEKDKSKEDGLDEPCLEVSYHENWE